MKKPQITDGFIRRIYEKYKSLVFPYLPYTYQTKSGIYMMEYLGERDYIITYQAFRWKQWRIMCAFKVNEEGDEIISIIR